MKNRIITILLVLMFLVGLSVLLYPFASDLWNTRKQEKSISSYDGTVAEMTAAEIDAIFAQAEAYNESLYDFGSARAVAYPEMLDGYWETLDITGTGIMGYITIESIDVNLPIYHGTDNAVLSVGAGHMQGTSLPIGGENTHSVISAHRGLPSAKLFTDLNHLEVGDTFSITVLDRTTYYEVDKIEIVIPTQLDAVYIEDGESYCTLMTCTPYGINTHRLLVRGKEIEAGTASRIQVHADASKVSVIVVAPFLAIPLFVVILVATAVRGIYHRRRGRAAQRKEEEI